MKKTINMTNKITLMIIGVFMMMLMALVSTEKVEAAGGSNFYNAQQIKFNKTYSATTPGDGYHYYKFKTGSYKATYKIKNINLNGAVCLHYHLYDEDLKNVDYSYTYSGETREFSDLKKNAIYYIEYHGGNYSSWQDEVDYVFSVKEVLEPPAKVVIDRISAGRKKLTVKWAGAPRAKAYQVAIKRAGGKWRFCNVSSKKKTFKRLMSRKKYVVKVRGYFTARGGAKKYGKWSSVRKVLVK